MPFINKNALASPEPNNIGRGIFVGREAERAFFLNNILRATNISHNIVAISGNGGVGKSTLLQKYILDAGIAEFKDYCVTTFVNERQPTPLAIMEAFADQLKSAGYQLPDFEKALSKHKDTLRRAYAERESGREAMLRGTVDWAGTVVEEVPLVGGVLNKMAKPAAEMLIKERHTNQLIRDAERLEDPIGDLTTAFVAELNKIAGVSVGSKIKRPRRVILFFDTFEQLSADIVPWLLDKFLEEDINGEVALVLAGRDSLTETTPTDSKRWLPYIDTGNVYQLTLGNFTEELTREFLATKGIINEKQVENIWKLSKGLPLWLGLFAANPGQQIDPTRGVVENFLRWIPPEEDVKRRLALEAALFSRPFNQDELAAFDYIKPEERPVLYHWLCNQSFIRDLFQDGRYIYHDEARDHFSRFLHQRSPDEYNNCRHKLAQYYGERLERLESEGGEGVYKTPDWLELSLAKLYQLLMLPEEKSHLQAIEQLLKTYHNVSSEQEEEIVRVLNELANEEANNLCPVLGRQVAAKLAHYVLNKGLNSELIEVVNYLLGKVQGQPNFPSKWQSRLFGNRGQTYRKMKEYQNAIEDFNKSLELDPEYPWAFAQRGLIYFEMKEYQKALEDFDKAIELYPNFVWYFTQRGLIYFEMKEYQKALEDFDKAIELNPKFAGAFAVRGLTYREMKEYQKAFEDFDKALELDSTLKWAIYQRGLTYREMKEYQKALEDFDKALELDPKYAWAFFQRGETYREMKEYQKALEDFDKVIELYPSDSWAFAQKGETYREMKEYQKALENFDKALELDSTLKWAFSQRGVTYREMKEYQKAIEGFDKALELDPTLDWAFAQRGEVYFAIGNLTQAQLDLEKAVELNKKYECKLLWLKLCLSDPNTENIQRLSELADVQPPLETSLLSCGMAEILSGEFEAALEHLSQSLEAEPGWWEAYFWKGLALAYLGHTEEAVVALETGLDEGIPLAFYAPLRWLEKDRPEFYREHAIPFLQQN